MVRPSAFAVVRLMTRSYLVGCSTGMSAGFAPRRILSTKSAARRYRSRKVRSIGHHPSRFDELANVVHRRQPHAQCQRIDANPVSGYERVVADINCLRAAFERLEGARDILRAPDF